MQLLKKVNGKMVPSPDIKDFQRAKELLSARFENDPEVCYLEEAAFETGTVFVQIKDKAGKVVEHYRLVK